MISCSPDSASLFSAVPRYAGGVNLGECQSGAARHGASAYSDFPSYEVVSLGIDGLKPAAYGGWHEHCSVVA